MSKTNWDPFLPKVPRHCSGTNLSSSAGTGDKITIDDLVTHMKQISDKYRERKPKSNQKIDWSFEGMELSLSSDDSNSFTNHPNDESFVEGLQSSISRSPSPDKESEEHIPTNLSEESKNSASDTESHGLRRSKRKRLPVMEFWRGQRPIYKRDSTGITDKIVDITDGTQYELKLQTKQKRKKRKNEFSSDHKPNKEINIFNLSIHNKRVKKSKKKTNSLNVKSMKDLIWKESTQSEGVDIAITNKNKLKSEAIGWLRIQGSREKKMSKTGDYRLYLLVVMGVLDFKVDDTEEVVVRTGDSFEVLSNTNYSLVNLRKDVAYISFTVFSK